MGEMVSYRSNGGTSEGYLAIPASGTASPAVIVIQEWWGLVPHIRSVADRFAEAGFVALAPDLYHGETTSEPDEAQRLLMATARWTRRRRTSPARPTTSPGGPR